MFIFAIWGLHSHTFEGDDLFYLQGHNFGRPIADSLFFLGYKIWGNNPGAFHILLVCLHSGATLIGGYVIFALTGDKRLATLSACLFLVNVSHYRVLHWVSCLGYPLALAFGLLCLLCLLKNRPFLAAISMILCVGSHPAGIAIPLSAILLAYRNASFWLVLGLGTLTVVAIIEWFPDSPQNQQDALFISEIVHLFLWRLGRLLTTSVLLFPNLTDIHSFDVLAGTLVFLVSFYIAVRHKSLWAIMIIMTMLPFIFKPGGGDWPTGPSRYLYFSSFAFCIFCGMYLVKLNRTCGHIILIVILILSAFFLQKSRALSAYMEARGQVAHGHLRDGLRRYEFAILHAPYLLPIDVYERAGIIALANGKTLDNLLKSAPQVPEIYALKAASALLENHEENFRAHIKIVLEAISQVPGLSEKTARALMTVASYYLYIDRFDQAKRVSEMALEFVPQYEPAQQILQISQKKIKEGL